MGGPGDQPCGVILGDRIEYFQSDYSSEGARMFGQLSTDSSSVIVKCCFGDMNSTLPACLSSGWSCSVGACCSRLQGWRENQER